MARNNFGGGLGGGISPALYSGGAVNLNTQPFMNYYMQTMAKKQAQDEALEKYYANLGNNLTPAGMHMNDIDDFVKAKNDWQNYSIAHKKEIARPTLDGGQAYKNYTSMYNNLQAHAARSKEKVKNLSAMDSVLKDPAKRSLLTQKTLDDISNAELPVTDPNYKPIDYASLNYNPKPFDLNDQGKLTGILGKFKGNESIANTVQNPQTGMQTVTYKNTFSPDQINGMTNIAHTLYHNHPGFKQMVDKEADPLSNNYDQLNSVFKEHYGRDIGDGEDMATAHVLSMNPNKSGRQATQKIPVNPLNMLAAREASQKRLIDYRQATKENAGDQAIAGVENFMADQESKAKSGGSRPYTHANGQKENAYDIKLTSDLEKIFTKSDPTGKHKITPDKVQLLENGDYLPIYYQKDEEGNPIKDNEQIAVNTTLTKPVDRNAVKTSLGRVLLTKKTAEKQLSNINSASMPSPAKTTKTKLPKNAFD